jgi:hypothetical protein
MSQEVLDATIKSLSEQINQALEEKATADAATAAQKIFDDAEADKKKKEQDDALALAKKQAGIPDKEKLIDFTNSLNDITYPIVGSPEAQAVVDRAIFCVDAMQKDLMARIELLK